MNPSLRRCIHMAVMVGAIGCVDWAAAQQGPAGSAPAAATPAAEKQKASPPRTDAAKRKAEAAKKAPKLDPTAAQGEVESGINALAQGRADAAVSSLSNALSAGSLPSAQTSRALYYRGVAYRRQGKPAQAISDLTNALWIKGGLTEEQRADALQQRSGAYREAGLPDQGDTSGARAASAAKPGSTTAPFGAVAPPPPGGSSTSLSGGGSGFFGALFGGSPAPSTTSAPAVPKTAAVTPPATTASVSARQPSTVPQPAAQVSQDPKPATRLVPVYSSNESSLPMGFQDQAATVRHVEVSTQARAAQPPSGASGVGGAVARPWDDATKVKQSPAAAARTAAKDQPVPAKSSQVAAASAPPPPVQAAAAPAKPLARASGGAAPAAALPAGGNVRVQVAAVRSAEEAKGVSAKLQSQFAQDLGGRAPVVDQVSAGNFGMFYRVQVGPFATVRDTEGLCAKLKSGGLDCRVVTQ